MLEIEIQWSQAYSWYLRQDGISEGENMDKEGNVLLFLSLSLKMRKIIVCLLADVYSASRQPTWQFCPQQDKDGDKSQAQNASLTLRLDSVAKWVSGFIRLPILESDKLLLILQPKEKTQKPPFSGLSPAENLAVQLSSFHSFLF